MWILKDGPQSDKSARGFGLSGGGKSPQDGDQRANMEGIWRKILE